MSEDLSARSARRREAEIRREIQRHRDKQAEQSRRMWLRYFDRLRAWRRALERDGKKIRQDWRGVFGDE